MAQLLKRVLQVGAEAVVRLADHPDGASAVLVLEAGDRTNDPPPDVTVLGVYRPSGVFEDLHLLLDVVGTDQGEPDRLTTTAHARHLPVGGERTDSTLEQCCGIVHSAHPFLNDNRDVIMK